MGALHCDKRQQNLKISIISNFAIGAGHGKNELRKQKNLAFARF
jgi:hypothetical protein